MNTDIECIEKNLKENFPLFLRPIDLIKCGLFKSRSDVSVSIRRGQAPPLIRLSSNKIVFPRALLCNWLAERSLVNEAQNAK